LVKTEPFSSVFRVGDVPKLEGSVTSIGVRAEDLSDLTIEENTASETFYSFPRLQDVTTYNTKI
jgi:hypothetical protein